MGKGGNPSFIFPHRPGEKKKKKKKKAFGGARQLIPRPELQPTHSPTKHVVPGTRYLVFSARYMFRGVWPWRLTPITRLAPEPEPKPNAMG